MTRAIALIEKAKAATVGFGKHKGRNLGQIAESDPGYLRWLAGERRKDPKDGGFKVPNDLEAHAKAVLVDVEAEAETQRWLKQALNGRPDNQGDDLYVIERLGDLKGLTGHHSLKAALAHLDAEFPKVEGEGGLRSSPDPEDDRILIWEILPSGHKKVVWHFSGWHWDADEFGLGQGSLPGDQTSLYELANF